jgi:membrane associated rhomboid family serine protease
MTVQETEAKTCFHHKGRETWRTCTRCERPACADCLTQAVVGSHCWECIKAARPPRKQRVRRWNAGLGPVVSYALIAVNVVVFVLVGREGLGDGTDTTLQEHLAVLAPGVADGEWYRLVTYAFVQADVLQLGFNMVALYVFGRELERDLGHLRFVALFFTAVLCGGFTAVQLEPTSFMWGSAAGVAGLIVATALSLRRRGASLVDGGVASAVVLSLLLGVVMPGATLAPMLGGAIGGSVVGSAMVLAGRRWWTVVMSLVLALAVSAWAVSSAVSVSS